MIELYQHQIEALETTKDKKRVAYYFDMGLGKTFIGSEKMAQLGNPVNLVICQKSKINDWLEHFKNHYKGVLIFDLTNKSEMTMFFVEVERKAKTVIGIINYELTFRRAGLKRLTNFTLMLDESSLIQNMKTERTKFIMSLNCENVILLSGTPTGGKYERLYSQLKLLGMKLSETGYMNTYINYHIDKRQGFPRMVIDGYKNVDRLKRKIREYGCVLKKTEEVFDLPAQIFIPVNVEASAQYRKFKKSRIVNVGDRDLVGDTTLTKMLGERLLCGCYSESKLTAFRDLLEACEERLIVFYNFNAEYEQLKGICEALERPYSIVNGSKKELTAYDNESSSITLIQYQSGAMGLNLQKANKIIYFSPPLSSELYEQSKKRIHRIGQNKTCMYYTMTVKGSIEQRIYKTLDMRRDYTDKLFESEGE